MLKVLAAFFAAILFIHPAYADCRCAVSPYTSNTLPATVFTFSDNMRLAVCGNKEIDLPNNQAAYTDFTLSICGSDTNIREVSPVEEHIMYLQNDTLYLLRQDVFAMGEEHKLTKMAWRIERIHFANGTPFFTRSINPELRYEQKEINKVLREYERAKIKPQGAVSDKEDERMMLLANKLLVAALSGSKKAERYFFAFAKQYKPGGHYAEWLEDMAEILDTAIHNPDN